jgi:carbonic anhydrase
MKKLIKGIIEFKKSLDEEKKALFAQLVQGQKPDALFIACCDSRVVPNLFASTNPGDLFVLRNVGNLVPPSNALSKDSSAIAALEFALLSINVSDIIVCGHSECGAIGALVDGIDPSHSHLISWLQYAKEALEKVNKGHTCDPSLSKNNQVSQMNVLQQMEHIASHPFVKKRKHLRIHGWWFDIAHADVYCYEKEQGRFVVLDEKEAKAILKRLL